MDTRSPLITVNPERKLAHLRPHEAKYNARVKYYPGESDPVQILVSGDYIFNPDRTEPEDSSDLYVAPGAVDPDEMEPEGERETVNHSVAGWHRAKRRAYDYVRCNPDLDCFLTVTLDGEKIARDDYAQVIHKLSTWLDNRVRRNGLKYILCPEYHKDGKSIHFHGLACRSGLKLVDSVNPHTGKPVRWKGKIVQNISDFPWGFTSAVNIDGEDAAKACAGYIFKYMSKQGSSGRVGGRYYLSGGDLQKPLYIYARVDYDEIDAFSLEGLPGMSAPLKIIQGDDLRRLLEGGEGDEEGQKLPFGGLPSGREESAGEESQGARGACL